MIELRVLGGIELKDSAGDEARGVLVQPKRLALLTYLALQQPRGFLRRDSLVATFWPHLDDDHARGALSQALRFLRRELEDALVERRGEEEISLAKDVLRCDSVRFEAACGASDFEVALEMYRGPLLDGFFIGDAPAFEQWLDGERSRLARLYARALEAQAAACSARGQFERAADCWRRRSEAEPYNAAVAQEFMLALVATGDRAGAIAHATTHEHRLATDLEAPPDAAVTDLAVRLRNSESVPSERGASQGPESMSTVVPVVYGSTLPSVSTSPLEPGRDQGDAAATRSVPTSGLRRAAWIGGLAGGLAVLALLTAPRGAARRPATLDVSRVAVLALQNETGRSDLEFVGLEVQDWIMRGLQETGLARVFAATPDIMVATGTTAGGTSRGDERSWAKELGVGTLVGGRYYLRGDSMLMQVTLIDVSEGRVIARPNLVVAATNDPTPAIDTLRQRAIGALAAHLDPALREWASFAGSPPSFEAYREFSEGQKAFNRDDYGGALVHYLHAAELASGYVYPLLIAAELRGAVDTGRFPRTDSLLRMVRARHQRLQPFDEALAREVEANLAGDYGGRLDAANNLRKYVAPGSTRDLDAVNAAIALNRPREAMAIVRGIDLHRESALDHWSVFIDIGNAYHLAGEDAALLALMRSEARKWQRGPLIVVFQMEALAALSRPAEVDSMWRTLLGRKDGEGIAGAMWAAVQGAFELRAHGFQTAAQRLAQEMLDSLPEFPPTSQKFDEPRIWKMHALRLVGRDSEARLLARAIVARSPGRVQMQAITAVLAARLGDTATARDIDARLAALKGSPDDIRNVLLARARIATALGTKDSAMALLHAACDQGCNFMETLHSTPDLEGLRTYRPFVDFLRPRG